MSTHVVYRCYDANRRLLYVGCTKNLRRRLSHHRNNGKTVASRVLRHAMTEVEHDGPMPEADALALETEMIQALRPVLNLQSTGIPGWFQTRQIGKYLEANGMPLSVADLARCIDCHDVRPAHRIDHDELCIDCAYLRTEAGAA